MAIKFLDEDVKAEAPVESPVEEKKATGIRFIEPSITETNSKAINNFVTMDEAPEISKEFQSQQEQLAALDSNLFTEDEIDSFKNNPIGFWDSGDYLDWEDVVPIAGTLKKAWDTGILYQLGQRYSKGEYIDEEGTKIITDFVKMEREKSLRGSTVGGKIALGLSQAPAWMIEFALTKGALTKVGEKIVGTTVKSAAKKSIKQKVGSAIVASAAAPVFMPSTPLRYGERRLNNSIVMTDKGQTILRENKESPIKSALMTYGSQSAEFASELSGEAIGKFVFKPIGRTIKELAKKTPLTTAVQEMPVPIQRAMYAGINATKEGTEKASKVMSKVGWNGILEEYSEEELANVLQTGLQLIGSDITPDQAITQLKQTKEDRLATLGVVSIIGSTSSAAGIGLNALQNRGLSREEAQESLNNMTETERDNLAEEQYPDPTSNYYARNLKEDIEDFDPETSDKENRIYDQQSIKSGTVNLETNSQNEANPAPVLGQESNMNEEGITFEDETTKWEDFVFQVTNDKAYIESLDPELKTNVRTYNGIAGTIMQNLQTGIWEVDENGVNRIVGKSFKSILDDFHNTTVAVEPKLKERTRDMNDYLHARRVIEDLVPREDVEVTEKQREKSFGDMLRLGDKYGNNIEWFETFSDEIYENQKQILHKLVKSGNLSQEQYDKIVEANPHYISFKRVIEDSSFLIPMKGKSFTKAKAQLGKIKGGSDLEVQNFLKTITENTAQIINISERNKIAQSIAENLVAIGQGERVPPQLVKKKNLKSGEEVLVVSDIEPKNTMTVYENGKRVFYRVNKKALREIEQMDANVNDYMRKLLKPFEISARIMRMGATQYNPDFLLRNPLRDMQMAFVQSELSPNIIDFAKGVFSVVGKNDLYKEWEASGGAFDSFMGFDEKNINDNFGKFYKEIYKKDGKLMRYAKNPLDIVSDLGEITEKATRLGLFAKARKKGITSKEAAFEARDATLDFSVGGKSTKLINRYIPFFKAAVRGTSKLFESAKRNPKGFIFKGVASQTLPTIVMTGYYLYMAPEDEREEYLEIPQWKRHLGWNFKVGEQWYWMPKAFALSEMFATPVENAMIWGYKGDKPESENLFRETVFGIAGSLTPAQDIGGVMPPLLKWAIEETTNYNFFTERSIFPEYMEKLEPEDQYNKYTPESLVALGKEIGISPARINHTLRSAFAGSSKYMTDMTDKMYKELREWNGEKVAEKPVTLSDMPLIRSLVSRDFTGSRSISVNNFYENWNNAKSKHASYNKKKGEEKKEFFEKHGDVIRSYQQLKGFNKQMSSLRKQIDKVYENVNMSSQQKVDKIRDIERKITDVSRKANELQKKGK
jgi:hypothetical protein